MTQPFLAATNRLRVLLAPATGTCRPRTPAPILAPPWPMPSNLVNACLAVRDLPGPLKSPATLHYPKPLSP